MKLQISGPSGIGKTTLAEALTLRWNDTADLNTLSSKKSSHVHLDYVSGSRSVLMKGKTQQDIVKDDHKTQFNEDFQLLNLRHKLFSQQENYVSDRGYLDLAAYFIEKQALYAADCDIEHFIEQCKMLLAQECTHLIFLPYSIYTIEDGFLLEDNGKRIFNTYYQLKISALMEVVLDLWEADKDGIITHLPRGLFRLPQELRTNQYTFKIHTKYSPTPIKVLMLNEVDLDSRINIAIRWLENRNF